MKKLINTSLIVLVILWSLIFFLSIFTVEVTKKGNESEASMWPGPVMYLPTLIYNAAPVKFTHDFETGDLRQSQKNKSPDNIKDAEVAKKQRTRRKID